MTTLWRCPQQGSVTLGCGWQKGQLRLTRQFWMSALGVQIPPVREIAIRVTAEATGIGKPRAFRGVSINHVQVTTPASTWPMARPRILGFQGWGTFTGGSNEDPSLGILCLSVTFHPRDGCCWEPAGRRGCKAVHATWICRCTLCDIQLNNRPDY